jgi:hypothetical protein
MLESITSYKDDLPAQEDAVAIKSMPALLAVMRQGDGVPSSDVLQRLIRIPPELHNQLDEIRNNAIELASKIPGTYYTLAFIFLLEILKHGTQLPDDLDSHKLELLRDSFQQWFTFGGFVKQFRNYISVGLISHTVSQLQS